MFKETFSSHIWEFHRVITPTQRGQAIHSPLHYGETMEILFTSGVTGASTINGTVYPYANRNVLYIAPKQLHSAIYTAGGDFIHVLHINIEALQPYIHLKNILTAQGRTLSSIPNECGNFDALYRQAGLIAQPETPFSEKLEATLTILRLLLSAPAHSEQIQLANENAVRLMDWMEKNYAQKITMQDAADYFGYNKNYFCRWVVMNTGSRFTDFVHSVRMSHACAFLVEGYTIEEVAAMCGYSNASYFIKIFKKFRGKTPKAYAAQSEQGMVSGS